MEYRDRITMFRGPTGDIRTMVTGAALKALNGNGIGPSDSHGLIDKNRPLLMQIAWIKYQSGMIDDDGLVEVTDIDVRG